MSERCSHCGWAAIAGFTYCPKCGGTPVPSLAYVVGVEVALSIIVVLGLVSIAIDRGDSAFKGTVVLLIFCPLMILLAHRYRKATARYEGEVP